MTVFDGLDKAIQDRDARIRREERRKIASFLRKAVELGKARYPDTYNRYVADALEEAASILEESSEL